MKNLKTIAGAAAFVAATSLAGAAFADIEFDQDVTPDVIFGTGNDNGAFTTDRRNGVEIGLRGKLRFNGVGQPENTFNSNGDGTYSFNNIVGPTRVSPTPEWSFEWTVNTDELGATGQKVGELTYELGLDGDPGLTTNFLTFDPITPTVVQPFFDHHFGDNTTTELTDTKGTLANYATLLSDSNVIQQSWRYDFFITGALAGFDPTDVGTYAIYLLAKDADGNVVAKSDIQILVGGASPVGPELTCTGFEPPLDENVSVNKPNRVLPLRIVLTNELGDLQTNDDLLSPPVLQFMYTGAATGAASLVELESVGKGDDGNMFSFGDDKWAFNLKTKSLAPGTYKFTAVSGDIEEYEIDPTCQVEVTIN